MLAEQIPGLCSSLSSAGIGRTGVLVTMETAMCLIERNLPVYPLDIVRKMRDQRAMMVQTSVSENPIIKIVTVAHASWALAPSQACAKGFADQITKGTASLTHGHRAC